MKLGRQTEYAIEGLLFLATKPLGKAMLLRDIAASRSVPRSFLAKIFQKLTRGGVVLSSRGATRGYALARPPRQIKVKDVLLAIEGPDLFERCIFWSNRCGDSNPCPIHDQWKRIRQQIIGGLIERTTLADLVKMPVTSSLTAKSGREELPMGRQYARQRTLTRRIPLGDKTADFLAAEGKK